MAWLDKKKSLYDPETYEAYVRTAPLLKSSQLAAIRNIYLTTVPEGGTCLGALLTYNHLEPQQQVNLDAAKKSKTNDEATDFAATASTTTTAAYRRETLLDTDNERALFSACLQRFGGAVYYRQPNGRTVCEIHMRQMANDCLLGCSASPNAIKFVSMSVRVDLHESWCSKTEIATVFYDNQLYRICLGLFDQLYRHHMAVNTFGVELKETVVDRAEAYVKFYFVAHTPDRSSLANMVVRLSGVLKGEPNVFAVAEDAAVAAADITRIIGIGRVYIIATSLDRVTSLTTTSAAAAAATTASATTNQIETPRSFLEGATETINLAAFLTCCMTGRYKPSPVTTPEESVTTLLTTILSTMRTACGGCSLKRTGLSKLDVGPLTFVAGESGRYEIGKYLDSLNKKRRLCPSIPAPVYPIESPNQRFMLNLPANNNVMAKDIMLSAADFEKGKRKAKTK
ncbi:hypothetical protein M8J76_017194 [Diaphorina citri]|nr:hypothetical protein M8J76_017194 [Diaphorina citri]